MNIYLLIRNFSNTYTTSEKLPKTLDWHSTSIVFQIKHYLYILLLKYIFK